MKHVAIALASLALLALPASGAETRPVFPLPEGLYSDGMSCGAAEIRRNRMWNGFGVAGVIGGTCELKAVTKQGDTYAFKARCSEGNGASAHWWTVASSIHVEGPDTFAFDGTTYRFCSAEDAGRTNDLRHHADRHLRLTAGSYRTAGGRCGGLVYLDNPHADLGGMFGGPDFGGDTCDVKHAVAHGGTVSFAATCIPTRDGAAMRISLPMFIGVGSSDRFEYAGRHYELCKRITY